MIAPTLLEIFHLVILLIFFLTLAELLIGKYLAHVHGEELPYRSFAPGLFPVVLVIVLVRSYVFEPFNIPSESMFPQLTTGDVVYVDKSSYDIKFPLTNLSLYNIADPKRGEVAVFKYPLNTKMYFIKRVIGLPGDQMVWQGDDLFINGQKIDRQFSVPLRPDLGGSSYVRYSAENLNGHTYQIRRLSRNDSTQFDRSSTFLKIRTAKTLTLNNEAIDKHRDRLEIVIPEGFYFVMGDNRDQSLDSREWGLVSRDNFVGRAEYNLLNFSKSNGFLDISFKYKGEIQ